MWEGPGDKGTYVVYELNALEECHEVEQETLRCSLGGDTSLKRVGRERKLMSLRANMGA